METKLTKISAFCLLVVASTAMLFAEDTENEEKKLQIKPYAKVYMNYHIPTAVGADNPTFNLSRAYFGIKAKHQVGVTTFTGDLTLDIEEDVTLVKGVKKVSLLDITDIEGAKHWAAYLKQANAAFMIEVIEDALSGGMTFGMQKSYLFHISEKIWGYRHVKKTIMDDNKFYSPADLGVGLHYRIFKAFGINAGILNGDGYNVEQNVNTLNLATELFFKLQKLGIDVPLVVQISSHLFLNRGQDAVAPSILSGFLGYDSKLLRVGLEYGSQVGHNYEKDRTNLAYSAFANLNLSALVDGLPFSIFGRYDILDDSKKKEDHTLLIAGLSFHPTHFIETTVSFVSKTKEDKSATSTINLDWLLRLY